jgi:hypothetical protein
MFLLSLLVLAGCPDEKEPEEPPPGPVELERDPTDYRRDRPTMEQFYKADPLGYWASYGLPPLARLAEALQGDGEDAAQVFSGIAQDFRESEFLAALERRTLPSDFASHATPVLEQGGTAWEAFLAGTRNLVQELDIVRAEQGPSAPRLAQITASLRTVMEISFTPAGLAVLAPEGSKVFTTERPPPANPVCQAGTDPFTSTPAPPSPAPDDQDTSTSIAWDKIEFITWRTTYNAACVAHAFGACGAKLGLFDNQVTCKEWNEFSQAVGAVPGQLGSNMDKACNWFRTQGYCCSTAQNGQGSTACAEAAAALRRGCDVMLHYESSDHTKAHVEMVRGFVSGSPDNGECSVLTLSWGKSSSVTYDNGTFSGKRDGRRYRQPGETSSYLEGSGIGTLYYYCRC